MSPISWNDPRTWLAGEDPSASVYNLHIRDNFKAIGDPWTTYSPTWAGTGFAIGNGSITGAWLSVGKLVIYRITATVGSTTTAGTGAYSFGLPATSAVINMPGGGITITSGGAVRQRDVYINSGSTVAGQDESGQFVSGLAPFNPPVSGATFKLAGFYQAT